MQHLPRKCGSRSVDHLLHASGISKKLAMLLRGTAHGAIRSYQLTLSSLVGQNCRHLPTCSDFMDEAIDRHGAWAGGWMGFARLCRCQPWGTSGFDPVPPSLPEHADWLRPWRYGRWRRPLTCEPCSEAPKSSEG